MKISKFLFAVVVLFYIAAELSAFTRLTIGDPRNSWQTYPGTIEDVVITSKPHGSYTEMELFFAVTPEGSIFNSVTDTLEAVLSFNLNPKAFINDSWLFLDDTTYVIAELMDKWTAGYIYEGIVQRRKDPSILFKRNANTYELRIFPLLGNSRRIVKINYFIPLKWNENQVSHFLPFDITKLSHKPIEEIDFIVHNDDNFTLPFVYGSKFKDFVESENRRYGNGFKAVFDPTNTPNPEIGIHHNFIDSIFVSYNEFKNEKFYQIIVPIRDLMINNPKKILILLDYEAQKSSYSKQDMVSVLQKSLKNTLFDQDYFNVYFSSENGVFRLKNDWIKADDESIDNAFQFINSDTLMNTTNLENLFEVSGNWIQEQQESMEILILANSDSHGSQELGNKLGSHFIEKCGNNRVSIASFLQTNWKRYFINNIGYAGNDYLYLGLVRLTKGYFNKIFDHSLNLEILVNYSLNTITGGFKDIEIKAEPKSGFVYSNYSLTDDNYINENNYFAEIGKYQGEAPFNIKVNGFFRNTPFSMLYNAEKKEYQYDNSTIWAGTHLRELENTQNNTSIIYEIIHESLKYNVLSIYTAFLALDTFDKHYLEAEEVVPVELIDFSGEIVGNKAVLSWSTASEKNNYGFYVDRSNVNDNQWESVGFVHGSGNSSKIVHYSFNDASIKLGNTYKYRLRQTDIDGTINLSPNIVELSFDKEINLIFEQNYPNPVTSRTTFKFNNPSNTFVRLEIFNMQGNKIKSLIDKELNSGEYEVNWTINDEIEPGIYFAKLSLATKTKVIKFIVEK